MFSKLFDFSAHRGMFLILGGGVLAVGAVACGTSEQSQGEPPVPEVGVVEIREEPVTIAAELAGRTVAYETSEVRPQVTGIIRQRLFTEGTIVRAGQVLYEIDPQVYQVAVEQASANLTSAEANLEAARARAERVNALVEIEAVSKQDQTDAVSAAAQAEAAVRQAKAALNAARINLDFTKIKAPISGRIGRSLVTTGALVTNAQAQPLAVIQRVDPMFVDIPQSSASILDLRSSLSSGESKRVVRTVRLRLENGSVYSHSGTLEATEASVDPNTGAITLRAKFPNPDGILLPGMYVHATVNQGHLDKAILAPQPGVMRSPTGKATAYIVNEDGKIETRDLTLDRTIGDRWLVTEGLRAGDRLVVEGTARVRTGQVVSAMPPEGESLRAVSGFDSISVATSDLKKDSILARPAE